MKQEQIETAQGTFESRAIISPGNLEESKQGNKGL